MTKMSSYCFNESDFLAITQSLSENPEKRDQAYILLKEYNKSIRQQFLSNLISKILSKQISQTLYLAAPQEKERPKIQHELYLTGEIHLDLSKSNNKQFKDNFKSNTFSSKGRNGSEDLSFTTVSVLL